MTRILVTVTHDDGRVVTFDAENPVRPQVEISTPDWNGDIGPVDLAAPFAIVAPRPLRVSIEFAAHPQHQITCTEVSTLGPAAPVPVRRDDLDTLYQWARYHHDGEAMTRVAQVLHATRLIPWQQPDGATSPRPR